MDFCLIQRACFGSFGDSFLPEIESIMTSSCLVPTNLVPEVSVMQEGLALLGITGCKVF